MAIMDLREKAHCWAGCDGCLSCVPDVAYTDATLADVGIPAPEEAAAVVDAQDGPVRCLDCTDPDCGS